MRRLLPRTRTRAAVILASAVLGAGLPSIIAQDLHTHHRAPPSGGTVASTLPAATSTPSTVPHSGWVAVTPDTTVPADTPAQEYYDQNLAAGLAGTANQASLARVASIELPAPSTGAGWPRLSSTDTPEGWVRQFATALLGIDFSRQTRSGLAGWVVAEEAPDLMPGIPPDAELGSLYVTLMAPQVSGQRSPVPDQSTWDRDRSVGLRWNASDIEITVDPGWQQLITAGWQPRDLRADVEDVSGVLTVTQGTVVTMHRFSLVVQVGSSHWQSGYGAVLVSDWQES